MRQKKYEDAMDSGDEKLLVDALVLMDELNALGF